MQDEINGEHDKTSVDDPCSKPPANQSVANSGCFTFDRNHDIP